MLEYRVSRFVAALALLGTLVMLPFLDGLGVVFVLPVIAIGVAYARHAARVDSRRSAR